MEKKLNENDVKMEMGISEMCLLKMFIKDY